MWRMILDAFAKLRKATNTVVMPMRLSVLLSAWKSSAPSEQIFIKFDILVFFENLSWKFKYRWDLTRITGTWHEDKYTALIIFGSVLLRMINVSEKVLKKIETHILCSVTFFFLIVPSMRYVEKYCGVQQATDNKMAYVQCMLDS